MNKGLAKYRVFYHENSPLLFYSAAVVHGTLDVYATSHQDAKNEVHRRLDGITVYKTKQIP